MPSQGSVRGLAAASLIALATLVVDHFHRLPVVAVALAGACALAVTLRLLRGLAETARSAHATSSSIMRRVIPLPRSGRSSVIRATRSVTSYATADSSLIATAGIPAEGRQSTGERS